MENRVINLAVLFAARRIASVLLERKGYLYFTRNQQRGPAYRLDESKIDMVVELARRDACRGQESMPPSKRDLHTCRRQFRREMIQRVTRRLVAAS
jgi:hypothetical protein